VRKKVDEHGAAQILAEHELGEDQFRLTIAILEQRFPPPKDTK
jgi:hypothetical protein